LKKNLKGIAFPKDVSTILSSYPILLKNGVIHNQKKIPFIDERYSLSAFGFLKRA